MTGGLPPKHLYDYSLALQGSLFFYCQGNDCTSRQEDDWPFDWTQDRAGDTADWDAAATDGRTDSEGQTGDVSESNYARLTLHLSLSPS